MSSNEYHEDEKFPVPDEEGVHLSLESDCIRDRVSDDSDSQSSVTVHIDGVPMTGTPPFPSGDFSMSDNSSRDDGVPVGKSTTTVPPNTPVAMLTSTNN